MTTELVSRSDQRRGGEAVSEVELLRDIDLAILDIDGDSTVEEIERLFLQSLSRFARVKELTSKPLCLVFTGSDFRPLSECRGSTALPRAVPLTTALAPLAQGSNFEPCRLIERHDDPDLIDLLAVSGPCLISPVHTSTHQLVCILVLSASGDVEETVLRDPQTHRGWAGLTSQLSIALGQFEQVRFQNAMQQLWGSFLGHNLEPSACFRTLAQSISTFLPVFGPLSAFDRKPQTQILLLKEQFASSGGFGHFVIRGTTGQEHSGTRVDFSRSISGLLMNSDDALFYGDPTHESYKERYRNYFGNAEHQARTELVVRMYSGGECVGVINLESERENAFSAQDQRTILDLAKTVGPIAAVLERRLIGETETQAVIAASTRKYLETLSQIFRHGMGPPSSALDMDNDALSAWLCMAEKITTRMVSMIERPDTLVKSADELKQLIAWMKRAHARLGRTYRRIGQYSRDFVTNIATYSDDNRSPLREIVGSSIKIANETLLGGSYRRISISIRRDKSSPTTQVFCSPLIKQHLQCIFDNSVRSVAGRMEEDGRAGKITVTIDPEPIREDQEQRLNVTWIVRIRDNGKGVRPDELAALRRFEPGVTFSSGGSGTGLPAAQKYVESVGGRMELNSRYGKYFEVVLYLAEYNPMIHGR